MKIHAVQLDCVWEDPEANRVKVEGLLAGLQCEAGDLVVLPEMFSTGFSMNAKKLAEEMEGPSMQWMFETAQGLKAAICGSLMIKENGKFFNRFIWMEPDGHYDHYDNI